MTKTVNTNYIHQRHYIDQHALEPTLANQKSRVSFSCRDWEKHQRKRNTPPSTNIKKHDVRYVNKRDLGIR